MTERGQLATEAQRNDMDILIGRLEELKAGGELGTFEDENMVSARSSSWLAYCRILPLLQRGIGGGGGGAYGTVSCRLLFRIQEVFFSRRKQDGLLNEKFKIRGKASKIWIRKRHHDEELAQLTPLSSVPVLLSFRARR